MIKVNTSPLKCIHYGCNTIPTIVLDFRNPYKIFGQILTCLDHRIEGIDMGWNLYRGAEIKEHRYPNWLQRLHEIALKNGQLEGNTLDPAEIDRLRNFIESRHRNPAERR